MKQIAHIKYIFYLGSLLLLILCGCTQEPMSDEPTEQVDISLKIGSKSANTELGDDSERKIGKLRIMIFNAKGYIEKNIIDEPAQGIANPYTKKITVISGEKLFCVVGNEHAENTAALNAISHHTELDKLTLGNAKSYGAESLLPFTGKEPITVLRGINSTFSISIKRAISKVAVSMAKSAELSTRAVKILGMRIKNTPLHSWYFPHNQDWSVGRPVDGTTLTSTTEQTVFNPDLLPTFSDAQNMLSCYKAYLYEHDCGLLNTNATTLVIRLNVGGHDMAYEIPIESMIDATKAFAIQRNVLHAMRIKVLPVSLVITYSVLDWESGGIWDKDPAGDDGAVQVNEWTKNIEYDANIDGKGENSSNAGDWDQNHDLEHELTN
ncbi:MAG: FimB/Mfa2 family fimbrial subunit [Muribaculaceae bacterium]